MLSVTATDLPRFMACNGSRLLGGFTPPGGDDTVRDEGNAADWLVAQVHGGHATADQYIDQKAPNGVYITSDMVDYLDEYLELVISGCDIETDTSFGGATWNVNGRADLTRYTRDIAYLQIGDLKYGWGIVEPENNWTLIAHAIGWVVRNPTLPVERITLTIFQPRPHHPDGRARSWTISLEQLHDLWRLIDATLSNPSDMLYTGLQCYRCPALAICPAARKAEMNALDASESAYVDEIDNDNLSFQLDHVKRAIDILEQRQKAYGELALHRVRNGQIVKNYMIESELTNRQWKEHVTPEIMQVMTGKDLSKKQLITPAQAEKAGVSKLVVDAFADRRHKGVKLVRTNVTAKAKKLFGNGDK